MRNLFLLFILFLARHSSAQHSNEAQLIGRMLKACESVKTAKFTMISTERLPNGKFDVSVILAKLKYNPKSVYMYMVKPNVGSEALWINNRPGAKVLISPGGFPFVNVRFSPHNSLLRMDSHHTIEEIGFEQIASMIRYYSRQLGAKFYSHLSIKDTVDWDNHSCVEIEYDFPEFSFTDYKVQSGETISTIAQKYFLNDYALLKQNPSVRHYDSVKPGQIIKLPNFYCRKLVFFIDRNTFLPIKQMIYDSDGLFEQYEMKSLILNPSFLPEEFTEGYKDYKF